jgi:hypothetical protein
MIKKRLTLFLLLFLITIVHTESEVSANNQHKVAFVFLSFAIFIVYCTLLLVYIFRYRIFRKSVPMKIDSKINFSNHNKIQPGYDQYFVINRFLRRLKANIGEEEKGER